MTMKTMKMMSNVYEYDCMSNACNGFCFMLNELNVLCYHRTVSLSFIIFNFVKLCSKSKRQYRMFTFALKGNLTYSYNGS